MTTENRYLSTPVKYKIVFSHEEGYSYSEIRDLIKNSYGHEVSRGTVSKLIRKFDETGSIKDRARSGRPNKMDNRSTRLVVRAVKARRTLSSKDIEKDKFFK